MQGSQQFVQLKELITKHFSLDDLADLCLHLQINFEELGRGGLSSTVRELLLYVHRQGRLPVLLEALAVLRSQVDWPTVDDLSPFFLAFDPFQRHDFYQHINLPPHYVPRPDLLADLRQAMLGNTVSLALTSAVPMNALHGMGGIGKSVMARALCDDPDVKDAFPDGILWATVGQTPDLVSRLREWIERLGGSITQTAPTIDQLRVTLADLLQERACLLIADDVWRREHATIFQVGGPRCRLLITTRDAAIARELGAAILSVPLMPPDEAVHLLLQWAQGNLAMVDEVLLQTVVKRVQYLPLAVKLAGSQLRLKKEPIAWLAAFNVQRPPTRRPETVHDSLTMTFALSLDDLDEKVRMLYATLSIFKEDEATPVSAIGKLWQGLAELEEDGTIELLADLGDRALLEWQLVGEQQVIRLHDLLREMMATELGEAGRLDAHRALLSAYRQTKASPNWASAPDDGYLHAHLAYHLSELADIDEQAAAELHGLFTNDTWLNVRVPADSYLYDSYLADLMLAWQRMHIQAAQQIETTQPATAFAHCIHYALIHTTANSMAANYAPALVARAIQVGIWSPQHALSIICRIPNVVAKAEMCIEVLAGCQEQLDRKQIMLLQTEALQAAQEIENEEDRVWVLRRLALQLSGAAREKVLVQALQAALGIVHAESQAEVLVALAPQLSDVAREKALAQVLQIAQEIGDEESRAEILIDLASQLHGETREKVLAQALQVVQEMKDERRRAEDLVKLATYLSGEAQENVLAQALQAAQGIRHEWGQAQVLGELAPLLREEMLIQALLVVQEIGDEASRVWGLGRLAPYLSGKAREKVLAQALQTVAGIGDEKRQARVLGRLAAHLSGEAQEKALARALLVTQGIGDEESRTEALVELVPYLSTQLLAQALQVAQGIGDAERRTQVLEELAPQLRGRMLSRALHTVQGIGDEWIWARVLVALAPQLSGEAQENALAQTLLATQGIGDEWKRAQILVELIPHLSGKLLAQALLAAQGIESEWQRAKVLVELASQLSGELLAQALQAAQKIGDAESRAQVLIKLAPQLSGEAQENALAQALQAAQKIRDKRRQAEVLGRLAPQLSGVVHENVLAQVLQVVGQIKSEWQRAEVLRELAPQLSGAAQENALVQALQAAKRIEDAESRAQVLIKLAPQLSGATQEDVLSPALLAAQEIGDEWRQIRVLVKLVPQLSGKVRENVLAQVLLAAQGIRDEESRAAILVELMPQLSGKVRENVLAQVLLAAQGIRDEGSRAAVLVELVPQLRGIVRENTLIQALQGAQEIWDEWSRAQVLAELVPQLNEPYLMQMFQNILLRTIWNLRVAKRENLLYFLAVPRLFTSDSRVFPPLFFATVVQSLLDICREWHWP